MAADVTQTALSPAWTSDSFDLRPVWPRDRAGAGPLGRSQPTAGIGGVSMIDGWPTCDQDACTGACISGETGCLARTAAARRAAALDRFAAGEELDARGVSVSDALFDEILNAAPRDPAGHPVFPAARFGQAIFKGNVRLEGAVLKDAAFDGVTFDGDAWFNEGTFQGAMALARPVCGEPGERRRCGRCA